MADLQWTLHAVSLRPVFVQRDTYRVAEGKVWHQRRCSTHAAVMQGPHASQEEALTACAADWGQDPTATGFGGRKFDITGLDSNAFYCLLTSETLQARRLPRPMPSAPLPLQPVPAGRRMT